MGAWPHISNAGGPTFRNPVIGGFHPDPSVCRVGSDYYLACSSFEYFPALPVFHSRDLVHWTQVGNAVDRPNQLPLADVPSSGGVYAPTLRYHDGRFWLITTVLPHAGTMIITASDPAGPWSDPVWVPGVPGIDPDLAWDDDGTCWCTYAGVAQVRLDPTTGAVLERPRRVWSGTPGAQFPEGPHLYHVGDLWYLMIAEGGTERGHGISIARGPAPDGPFEACATNPILSHRSTDHPIQNTGHGDLVQAQDGSWWLLFLASRPRGGTPGWHAAGREVFLASVTWVDKWPVIGPVETVLPVAPPGAALPPPPEPTRDDFECQAGLHPRWISPRTRPPSMWSLTDRPGWLALHSRGGSLDEPDVSFIGRRQQHLSCRVRARVDPGTGRGGLAVRLDEQHHYGIEVGGGQIAVRARIGPLMQWLGTRPVPPGPLTLRVDVLAAGPGMDHPRQEPDLLRLGFETADGGFTALAELDGRYLSTEVAGGFTGRVIGLYAVDGTVCADWFDYERL